MNNGAVIARSSQPEVGWLGWRSSEDEDLLKALADACSYDKGESTIVLDSPVTYSDVGDDAITPSAAKVRILKCSSMDCAHRKSDQSRIFRYFWYAKVLSLQSS